LLDLNIINPRSSFAGENDIQLDVVGILSALKEKYGGVHAPREKLTARNKIGSAGADS
jgi:hypothetical protein